MAGSGSVQLTSGQQITSHSVTILPDVFSEGTESFGLTLSNPSIQFNGMGLNLQTDEAARLQLGADAATVEILDANGKTKLCSDYNECILWKIIKSIFIFHRDYCVSHRNNCVAVKMVLISMCTCNCMY